MDLKESLTMLVAGLLTGLLFFGMTKGDGLETSKCLLIGSIAAVVIAFLGISTLNYLNHKKFLPFITKSMRRK